MEQKFRQAALLLALAAVTAGLAITYHAQVNDVSIALRAAPSDVQGQVGGLTKNPVSIFGLRQGLLLVDQRTQQIVGNIQLSEFIEDLAVSVKRAYIVEDHTRNLIAINLVTQQTTTITPVSENGRIRNVAVSPDQKHLIVTELSDRPGISIYNQNNLSLIRHVSFNDVHGDLEEPEDYKIAFSPNSKTVAISEATRAAYNTYTHIVDLEEGLVGEIEHMPLPEPSPGPEPIISEAVTHDILFEKNADINEWDIWISVAHTETFPALGVMRLNTQSFITERLYPRGDQGIAADIDRYFDTQTNTEYVIGTYTDTTNELIVFKINTATDEFQRKIFPNIENARHITVAPSSINPAQKAFYAIDDTGERIKIIEISSNLTSATVLASKAKATTNTFVQSFEVSKDEKSLILFVDDLDIVPSSNDTILFWDIQNKRISNTLKIGNSIFSKVDETIKNSEHIYEPYNGLF